MDDGGVKRSLAWACRGEILIGRGDDSKIAIWKGPSNSWPSSISW